LGILSPASQAITDLIKQIEEYIDVELNLMEEAKITIGRIKNYINEQTPDLNDLAEKQVPIYEEIEKRRETLITQIREKVIPLLNDLLESSEGLTAKEKELEDAKKKKTSAKKKLKKLESKSMDKVSVEMIRTADDTLIDAKSSVVQLEKEFNEISENFEDEKLATIRESLELLYEIKMSFYNKAAEFEVSEENDIAKGKSEKEVVSETVEEEVVEADKLTEEIEELKELEEDKGSEEPKKKQTLDFDSLL